MEYIEDKMSLRKFGLGLIRSYVKAFNYYN